MKYIAYGDPDQRIIEGNTAVEILDSFRGASTWAEDDLSEYAKSLASRLIKTDGVALPSDPEGLVKGMIDSGILIPVSGTIGNGN